MTDARPLTYAETGVSLAAGEAVVGRIAAAVRSTRTREVMDDRAGFAGLYAPSAGDPFLAASCDGVGTKVELAREAGRVHGLGIDLVAMCVNDAITTGARPAFFLDYIACGKVDPQRVAEVVEGIAEGCRLAGCTLLGGETAEHPGVLDEERFDLAGFCVAIAERRELIGGARIRAGDRLVGLASSGPHANGFSLVRRLLERAGISLDDRPGALGGASVADALLEPTRIYAAAARALIGSLDVRGMAHVTGGGIPGNLARPLPDDLGVRVDVAAWERPAVFGWLASLGVEEDELRRVFNLGLGFGAYVAPADVELALATLERAGYPAFAAGEVIAGDGVTFA